MKLWIAFAILVCGLWPVAAQTVDRQEGVIVALQVSASSQRPEHGALDWSQGILALVRSSAPTVPLYAWNMDTLECGQGTVSQTLYFRNFGPETIWLSCATVPAISGFSGSTGCSCSNTLAPGQTSGCGVTIYFNPATDGIHRDTLSVETDAINGYGGYLRVPLVGWRKTTVPAPQLVVLIQDGDAHLSWNPVTHSLLGCPVSTPAYRVYLSFNSTGTAYLSATTADTSYLFTGVVSRIRTMYFHVKTVAE